MLREGIDAARAIEMVMSGGLDGVMLDDELLARCGGAYGPAVFRRTAVMAVTPGRDARRRSFQLARTALARVGITLRRRTANHRRGPSPPQR